MTTKKATSFPTEIAALKRLSSEAAAFLASVNHSTLRSAINEIQPDADGRYEAQEVVRWVSSRQPSLDLDDDDYEIVLRAAEATGESDDDQYSPSFAVDAIRRLRRKNGRRVDSLIVDELLVVLSDNADDERRLMSFRKLTSKELLARQRQEIEEAKERKERAKAGVALRCETCGRIRKGRT